MPNPGWEKKLEKQIRPGIEKAMKSASEAAAREKSLPGKRRAIEKELKRAGITPNSKEIEELLKSQKL